MLNDLFDQALVGSLYPQPMNVPTPFAQGIGGLSSALPQLFAQAWGPKSGLAGMLSGGSASDPSSMSSPAFGATPDRAALGLKDPSLVAPGFLTPAATVQQNMPPVRSGQPKPILRLQRKIDRREGLGLPTGKQEARLARKEERIHERRGYIPSTETWRK